MSLMKTLHRLAISIVFLFSGIFSSTAQQFYLPTTSLMYPDSFAIYWTTRNIPRSYDTYSLRVKCMSLFEDDFGTFAPTTDTIVLLPFTDEMEKDDVYLLDLKFLKNGKQIRSGDNPRIVKRAPKSERIESMKATVRLAPTLENLQLLANAFEEEKCYLNAVHVYERMIYSYRYAGRLAFKAFISRHPDAPRKTRGAVHR